MEILIAGDLVPTEKNSDIFKKAKLMESLGEDFERLWTSTDYRMFNLECPLGKNLKPIDKNGPNLIADEETIVGIKELKPDLVFLSNNHILDYGVEGVNSTEEILEKENLKFIGIVENSETTPKPYFIEKDGIKVRNI